MVLSFDANGAVIGTRAELIAGLRDAKKAVTDWTAYEKKVREAFIATFTTVNDPLHDKIETVEDPNIALIGLKSIKIEHKLNYKLDDANDYEKLGKVEDQLTALIGEELTRRLFKQKVELSISEYKKLEAMDPVAKKLVDTIVTVTPATKNIKIEVA